MTPISSILACTDFSVDGHNAVRRAALLAQAHDARLHVLHVVNRDGCKPLRDWFAPTMDIELKAAQARDALRRAAVEILGAFDVPATIEVRIGDPIATPMEASEHADLVVLGRQGHSQLETLLIGRTADRMLRMCRRPVLLVKKAAGLPYGRVLAPVDFTTSSDSALRFAARLARGAQLHVFHATDTYVESVLRRSDVSDAVIRGVRVREQAAADARMRDAIARLGLSSAPVSFTVGRGRPDLQALQCAWAVGADLIVAGKQGRSVIADFLLGSVSGRLVEQATCDVVIVPTPRDQRQAAASSTNARRAGATPAKARGAANWMHNRPRFAPRRAL